MSKLFVVGTPIGNLGDITFRAVETLKEVDFIACEDTKRTLILLKKYDINKPLISYHKFSEQAKTEMIIKKIESGQICALVTDAGMPGISDPGAVLVKQARIAGLEIESVPGPSAVTTAISIAGMEEYSGFCFLGFLPQKTKDRENLLSAYKYSVFPLVIYVSPHDVDSTKDFLIKSLGDRKIVVVKELTKIHESVIETNLSSLNIDTIKGEFVFIVCPTEEKIISDQEVCALIKEEIEQGKTRKEAIMNVSQNYNISKNRVYKCSLKC